MTRNLKALGVAAIAALAMSAVVASAAQAESTGAKLTAGDGSYPESFSGTNSAGAEVLTTGGGTVECASSFSGSLTEASQTAEVHPEYSGCKAFGFLSATVNTEECDFVFHLITRTGEDSYQATTDIACPSGQSIKIAAATCKVEIGSQNGLEIVDIENTMSTTPNEITIDANLSDIGYTVTQDGIGCPFAGTGNRADGTYLTEDTSRLTIAEQLSNVVDDAT